MSLQMQLFQTNLATGDTVQITPDTHKHSLLTWLHSTPTALCVSLPLDRTAESGCLPSESLPRVIYAQSRPQDPAATSPPTFQLSASMMLPRLRRARSLVFLVLAGAAGETSS